MKRKLFLGGIILTCLLLPMASALACNQIVAFGDSLSDNGPMDGFGLDVWTNGNVWVEYLATEMNVPLEDRAMGGAKTSGHINGMAEWGLDWQIAQYLDSNPSSAELKHTLFTIWIGGNDFLSMTPDMDPNLVIAGAMESIQGSVAALINAGAKNILVLTLPNLGATPLNNGDPATAAGARFLTEAFNDYLRQTMCGFTMQFPRVRFYMVDVFELLEFILDDPETFGFVNITEAGDESNNWEGYVFWDAIHPTTDAHRVVAAAAIAQVKPWAMSWESWVLVQKISPLHPMFPFEFGCYIEMMQ